MVPLNVMLKAPEIAFQLSDSGARLLITWEGVLADAAKGAEVGRGQGGLRRRAARAADRRAAVRAPCSPRPRTE